MDHIVKTQILKKPSLVTLLLAWFALAGLFADSARSDSRTDSSAARAVVDSLHHALLQSMQAATKWDQQQRYAQLAPVIDAAFDTRRITKIVLGRYWRKLSKERQSHFIDLLQQLNIATYASRFNTYTGASFTFVEAKSLPKGRILIKTRMNLDDKKKSVSLDYLLHKEKKGIVKQEKNQSTLPFAIAKPWKIIGVFANGINELSLKRAEYTGILKAEGEEQLIQKITNKLHITMQKA